MSQKLSRKSGDCPKALAALNILENSSSGHGNLWYWLRFSWHGGDTNDKPLEVPRDFRIDPDAAKQLAAAIRAIPEESLLGGTKHDWWKIAQEIERRGGGKITAPLAIHTSRRRLLV